MLPRLLSSLPQFAVWLCLSSLLSRSSLIRLRVLYSCSLRRAEREIDCSQFSCRLNCIDLSPIHADEELCYLLITTAIPSWHQWDGCTGVGEFIGPWGDALGCAGLFPDPSGPYERDWLLRESQQSSLLPCVQCLSLEESATGSDFYFPLWKPAIFKKVALC